MTGFLYPLPNPSEAHPSRDGNKKKAKKKKNQFDGKGSGDCLAEPGNGRAFRGGG